MRLGKNINILHICGCLLFVSSCSYFKSDTDGKERYTGPFTIELSAGVSGENDRTRAEDFNNGLGVSDISEIWVGLFDATDHRFIGYGTTSGSASLRVKINNLFFDDGHPDAYAAAVANYRNVYGRLGSGEMKALEELLERDIASWEDFCNIAVDAVSAERAIGGDKHVLMSGVYYKTTAGRNITVQADGKGRLTPIPDDDNVKATMFSYTETAAFEQTVEFNSNLGFNQNYTILLRPLFSHVTVNVTLTAADLDRNGGISWRLCNVPRYVYLIEHVNVEDCRAYDASSWLGVTPAASDLYGDAGYYTMDLGGFRTADDRDIVSTDVPFDVMEKDIVSGNNGRYSFGYWHYENKHWGLPGVDSFSAREATYEENAESFKALCPSYDEIFNNKATYFELRVKGTDSRNYDFRVHEGLSSNRDNSAGATEYRDFSTFRNTDYTYNVTISGTSSGLTRSASSGGTGHEVNVSVSVDDVNRE